MATTAQKVITKVRVQLMEPVAGFWSDEELLLFLNEAQNDLADQMRGVETKAYMSTTAGRADYALPQGWLSTRAIFYKRTDSPSEKWSRMVPTNLEKVAQETPDFITPVTEDKWGSQVKYWIWDRSLYFTPAPFASGSNNILMFYKSTPNEITLLTENLAVDDIFSPAIESYILARAWEKQKESELATVAWNEYGQRARRGLRWVKKQSGDQLYAIDAYSAYPISGGGIGGGRRNDPLSN